MEDAVRQHAESDTVLKTVRDAESMLREENENLRKRVYELQKIDADREVKMSKLESQYERVQSNMLALNMALDSKQQEVQMVSDLF